MTYQEIVTQARQLPIKQRLALIDVITRSLQLDLGDNPQAAPNSLQAAQSRSSASGSTLHRIRGIAATTPPPSDAEIDAMLIESRIEKHLR